MNSGQNRQLNVVSDDQSEIDELREELNQLRDECQQWQAATMGIVAGLALIIGLIVMALQQ